MLASQSSLQLLPRSLLRSHFFPPSETPHLSSDYNNCSWLDQTSVYLETLCCPTLVVLLPDHCHRFINTQWRESSSLGRKTLSGFNSLLTTTISFCLLSPISWNLPVPAIAFFPLQGSVIGSLPANFAPYHSSKFVITTNLHVCPKWQTAWGSSPRGHFQQHGLWTISLPWGRLSWASATLHSHCFLHCTSCLFSVIFRDSPPNSYTDFVPRRLF